MKEFFSVFKLEPALFEGETGGRDQSGATQETGATAQATQSIVEYCSVLYSRDRQMELQTFTLWLQIRGRTTSLPHHGSHQLHRQVLEFSLLAKSH